MCWTGEESQQANCRACIVEFMSNHNRKSLVREDQATVTIGTKSWDALWTAAIPARRLTDAELAKDGWKTVAQIAELWGVFRAGCLGRLNRLIEDGSFERMEAGIGPTQRRGYVYRPKPPGVTRLVR